MPTWTIPSVYAWHDFLRIKERPRFEAAPLFPCEFCSSLLSVLLLVRYILYDVFVDGYVFRFLVPSSVIP